MRDTRYQHNLQVKGVLDEYRRAHKAGSVSAKLKLRSANPDLVDKFDQLDNEKVQG